LNSVRVGIPNTDGRGSSYVTFSRQERGTGSISLYGLREAFWDDKRDGPWLEGIRNAVGRLAPLDYNVRLDYEESFTGHSSGMMFALGLYSVQTGMRLRKVIGSATIDENGFLGPVDGIQEKLAAAVAEGYDYFITHYSQAHITGDKIWVVGANTLAKALSIATDIPLWRIES
jgi:PDZ domain-containing secreted protein